MSYPFTNIQGKIRPVIEEIILQNRVEFNVEEESSGLPAFGEEPDS